MTRISLRRAAALLAVLAFAGCGGGGDGSSLAPSPPYSVGGTVSGLTGTGLVLQNNGGNDLAVNASGPFTFSTGLGSGAAYAVTVKTQPTGQRCVVTAGSGNVVNAAVSSVVVTCGPQVAKFLYVPNLGSNSISAYAINASTGALTAVAGSPFSSDRTPALLSADPAGKYLYVASRGSANAAPGIAVHAINATTGALTQVAGSPFELTHNPPLPNTAVPVVFRPLVHPSGAFGYAATIPGDQLYGASVDAASGALTEIPGFPVTVGVGVGVGNFNAAGTRLYQPHNSITTPGSGGAVVVYQVTAPAGTLTPIGTWATGGAAPTIALLTPDGKVLLVANGNSGTVASYLVDASAGTLTPVLGSPFSTGSAGNIVTSLAVHATKNFVFATNSNNGVPSSIAAFQVNTATGVLTAATGSPFATGGSVALLGSIDPSGRYFYVSNRGSNSLAAFAIDQTTGALAHVAGSPFTTPAEPVGVAMDPSGKYLYAANSGSGSVTAYAIDAAGALTVIGTVPAGTQPSFGQLVGVQ